MYHYLWFKALVPLFLIASMNQISQNSLTLLSDSPYDWVTSCWIKTLKLQTLDHFWFISSHYIEDVDNYNKEKVATNKITPTAGITDTTKIPPLKLFLYFRDSVY